MKWKSSHILYVLKKIILYDYVKFDNCCAWNAVQRRAGTKCHGNYQTYGTRLISVQFPLNGILDIFYIL